MAKKYVKEHRCKMPIYNTSLKNRRFGQDPDESKRSRRFMGLDFLFVVLFMFFALYVIWPQYFKKPESYAPKSVINNVAFTLLEIQQEINHSSQESLPSDQLTKLIQQRIQDKNTLIYVLICNTQGDILYASDRDEPEIWSDIQTTILNQKQGTHIHTREGKATLIMFNKIPTQDFTLVVMQPFPPLFLNQ